MSINNRWFKLALFNLCIVALLGFLLRSKILFPIPALNYLELLDAHSHFAFAGWATLALLSLQIREFLPDQRGTQSLYHNLFLLLSFSSYGMLFTFYFDNNGITEKFFTAIFILTTYIFAWVFIRDIRNKRVVYTARLLVISSLFCLVLSSAGIFVLELRLMIHSPDPYFFRDAVYFYLHFQYNGFFVLAVFALLFHRIYPRLAERDRKRFQIFSIFLSLSVIPTLFLSFLWQEPLPLFKIIALSGSLLNLIAVIWFIFPAWSYWKLPGTLPPLVRFLILLSMGSFVIKMLLQSFTIIPVIGHAVFGNRPAIIGYLHLVFLGLLTPFILFYFIQLNVINTRPRITKTALIIFLIGIIMNELVLMLQGLGELILIGGDFFLWSLWIISIWIFAGALLIFRTHSLSGKIQR